ncbi:collagenase 3-like [Acanthaster planci]|uniref:Collagenase 3-like n=1 Tax=Acanthaster planci TaxID=133434 RepID=A0A8B7YSU5_ACAPL|nr:collagenase 3-like [Acanthaster planci]
MDCRISVFSALKMVFLAISCLNCRISESAPAFFDLMIDPRDILTLVKAASFLSNYGYITPQKGNMPPEQMNVTEMSLAIRKMQRYAAVNQTGVLDEATVRMINTARCGVHDEPEELTDTRIENYGPAESGDRRKKRYVVAGLNFKWKTNDITYKYIRISSFWPTYYNCFGKVTVPIQPRIVNYPERSRSRITDAQVRDDTERALKVWSDVTPLSFTRVSDNEAADIEISFGSYYHSDIPRDPTFDGPGGTLGHAFFPNSGWGTANGDVHLDNSETFTHREVDEGTDYFYTVAHEIGHALGLAHATDKSSLMFPYDKGYIPDFVLPEDDTYGIQLLYGPKPDGPSKEAVDTPTVARTYHEICQRGVDSLTVVNNVLHVFSGSKFWKMSTNKEFVGSSEGTVCRDYFERLKVGATAVYTRWDGKVVFFKGKNYWTYDGKNVEENKASKIASLAGVPKSPTAVMQDRDQRHTYFFKYSKVWKYDELAQTLVDGFPLGVHKVFDGLPAKSRVRAAFVDAQGDRYLLVGREFYRFPNGKDQLDPEYPKDFLVEYFDCPPEQ